MFVRNLKIEIYLNYNDPDNDFTVFFSKKKKEKNEMLISQAKFYK